MSAASCSGGRASGPARRSENPSRHAARATPQRSPLASQYRRKTAARSSPAHRRRPPAPAPAGPARGPRPAHPRWPGRRTVRVGRAGRRGFGRRHPPAGRRGQQPARRRRRPATSSRRMPASRTCPASSAANPAASIPAAPPVSWARRRAASGSRWVADRTRPLLSIGGTTRGSSHAASASRSRWQTSIAVADPNRPRPPGRPRSPPAQRPAARNRRACASCSHGSWSTSVGRQALDPLATAVDDRPPRGSPRSFATDVLVAGPGVGPHGVGDGARAPRAARPAVRYRSRAPRFAELLDEHDLEIGPEDLVVAVGAVVVDRGEHLAPLELGQDLRRSRSSRGARRTARRSGTRAREVCQQEPARLGRQLVEHVAGQVLVHDPRTGASARRRTRRRSWRRLALGGQVEELEPGGPALGAAGQGGEIRRRREASW